MTQDGRHSATGATPSSLSGGGAISARLDAARREVGRATVAAGSAELVWRWIAALLVLLVVDALWPMGVLLRLAAAVLLSVGIVWIVWSLMPPRRVRGASSLRLARLVERRLMLAGNPLVNALQLQPLAAGGPSLTTTLASRAEEVGDAAALQSRERSVADHAAARRAGRRLAAAGIMLILTALICPRLFAFGVPRLAMPLTDHPSFTWLDFAVTIEPRDELLVGDSARVRARIENRPVEAAEIVVLSERVESSRPMRAGSDGFTATLHDLREPISFFIRTERGRSKRQTIDPLPVPRWVEARAVITEPEYVGRSPRLVNEFAQPLRIMQGGRIDFHARGSLPVRGLIVETPEGRADLSRQADSWRQADFSPPDEDRQNAHWSFEANEPGRFEFNLSLESHAGFRSRESIGLIVDVQRDEPPTIAFERPTRDSAALPQRTITAHLVAQDDVGLTRVELHSVVEREGKPPAEHVLEYETNSARRLRLTPQFDLASLDLQSGDTVRYWAKATDGRPQRFGGQQSATTREYEILIIDEATAAALGEGGEGVPQSIAAIGEPGDESAEAIADGRGRTSEGEDRAVPSDGERDATAGEGAGEGGRTAHGDLLARARDRIVYGVEEEEPLSGQIDPERDREHLEADDDDLSPPDFAPDAVFRRAGALSNVTGAGDGPARWTVPTEYHDLVARYFRRLARDEVGREELRDE